MLGRAAPLGSDKKRQFDYNENPASVGFLLSGDTTGVFARCIASVPLSYRRNYKIIFKHIANPAFVYTVLGLPGGEFPCAAERSVTVNILHISLSNAGQFAG